MVTSQLCLDAALMPACFLHPNNVATRLLFLSVCVASICFQSLLVMAFCVSLLGF